MVFVSLRTFGPKKALGEGIGNHLTGDVPPVTPVVSGALGAEVYSLYLVWEMQDSPFPEGWIPASPSQVGAQTLSFHHLDAPTSMVFFSESTSLVCSTMKVIHSCSGSSH